MFSLLGYFSKDRMNKSLIYLALLLFIVNVFQLIIAVEVDDEIVETLENGCTLTRSKSGTDQHMTERLI